MNYWVHDHFRLVILLKLWLMLHLDRLYFLNLITTTDLAQEVLKVALASTHVRRRLVSCCLRRVSRVVTGMVWASPWMLRSSCLSSCRKLTLSLCFTFLTLLMSLLVLVTLREVPDSANARMSSNFRSWFISRVSGHTGVLFLINFLIGVLPAFRLFPFNLVHWGIHSWDWLSYLVSCELFWLRDWWVPFYIQARDSMSVYTLMSVMICLWSARRRDAVDVNRRRLLQKLLFRLLNKALVVLL